MRKEKRQREESETEREKEVEPVAEEIGGPPKVGPCVILGFRR